ncbi:MAG: hypothetical protein ACD_75C01199G0006, partial [uncultured bacterium]
MEVVNCNICDTLEPFRQFVTRKKPMVPMLEKILIIEDEP